EGLRDPRTERVEPRELRFVRGRADRLAVHYVRADHPEVTGLRREDPGLAGDRVALEAGADVLQAHPGQDRDPVVRALTERRALVPRGDELHRGEQRVLDLGLLQAYDVRFVALDHGQDAWESLLDRIDVPGHEPHGRQLSPAERRDRRPLR